MSTYKTVIEKIAIETKKLVNLIKTKKSRFNNIDKTQIEIAQKNCLFPHVQFQPTMIACHHCNHFINNNCDMKKIAECQFRFFIQYLFNYQRKIKCIERIELTNNEIKIIVVSLCQFNNFDINNFEKLVSDHCKKPDLFLDKSQHEKLPEHVAIIARDMCNVHNKYFMSRTHEILNVSEKQPAKKSSKRNKKTAKK